MFQSKNNKINSFFNFFWSFSISNIFLTNIISPFFFLINLIYIFYISIKNKFFYKLLKYKFFKDALIFFSIFLIIGLIINVYLANSVTNQIKFLSLILVFFFPFFFGYYLWKNNNIYVFLSRIVLYFNSFIILDIWIFSFFRLSIFPFVADINYFQFSRYGGVFLDEMVLGGYLCVTFPLILNYLKRKLKNIDIFFYNNLNLFFFTYLFSIILTGDRKPSIIMMFFLLINFLVLEKKYFSIKIFFTKKNIFLIIFVLIFPFILNEDKLVRFTSDIIEILSNTGQTNNFVKGDWFNIYHSSFQIIQLSYQNFIIGIGSKNFDVYCLQFISSGCSSHPHNLYIEMFVSFGVIGFVLFVTGVYRVFNFLIKVLNILKFEDRYLVISIIMIQIFFFVPFLPSGGLFATNLLIYFSLLNSISVMNLLILRQSYDFKIL